MKHNSLVGRATDFGTLRARENFVSFALKCIFYILPAVVLGNFTDIAVEKIKNDEHMGDNLLYYIILQTFAIIITLYLLLIFLTSYTSEFQFTLSGSFFIVLYFGLQTNYLAMIKDYINK